MKEFSWWVVTGVFIIFNKFRIFMILSLTNKKWGVHLSFLSKVEPRNLVVDLTSSMRPSSLRMGLEILYFFENKTQWVLDSEKSSPFFQPIFQFHIEFLAWLVVRFRYYLIWRRYWYHQQRFWEIFGGGLFCGCYRLTE